MVSSDHTLTLSQFSFLFNYFFLVLQYYAEFWPSLAESGKRGLPSVNQHEERMSFSCGSLSPGLLFLASHNSLHISHLFEPRNTLHRVQFSIYTTGNDLECDLAVVGGL